MPANAELQKWLAEKVYTAGLTEEQKQQLTSILGVEAVAEQLNRALMAPPDYNRKMDELRQKEADLNAELQNHIATLNNWKTGEESKVNQWKSQVQADYEAKFAALQKQMTDEGLQPNIVHQPPASANGNGKPASSFTQEQVSQLIREELQKAAFLPALTTQIVESHRQLFGAVPDMARVTDTALRTGKTLEATWREMYKVEDKEKANAEAAYQKRVDDEVNARIAKLQSDASMNQQNFGRPNDPVSPIRQMIQSQRQADANSSLAIPSPVLQESDAVRDAVEAHRSGKYTTKYPGQP